MATSEGRRGFILEGPCEINPGKKVPSQISIESQTFSEGHLGKTLNLKVTSSIGVLEPETLCLGIIEAEDLEILSTFRI